MQQQTQQTDWRKVVYRQDDLIKTAQGLFSDLGQFVQVVGDYKEIIINKSDVIAIHKTLKRTDQNGR